MSGPPTGSRAPYIIICSGRTEALEAGTVSRKICAASRCAADLVKHLAEVHKNKLKFEDTKAISDLQHEMMDNLRKWKKPQADEKISLMFHLLYELEEKFEGEHGY